MGAAHVARVLAPGVAAPGLVANTVAQSGTPTLAGWLARDALISAVLGTLLYGLWLWHAETGSLLAAAASAAFGFITAYMLCYMLHEWGHLIGARLTHSHMPLNRYASPGIGRFDITVHTRRQFVALSWGGVAGYVLATCLFLAVWATGGFAWVGAGLAVGGLAFVSQSLAVDMPQIVQVMRGADPLTTNQTGATPQIIVRRTWQTWLPLAGAIGLYALL